MDSELNRQKQLIEELIQTIETHQDLYRVMATLDKKATPKLSEDRELKPRFDSSMLYDTICYLLENKPTPQEAFDYTADLYQKDKEWMKVAKNTQLRKYVHTEVAKAVIKSGSETVSDMLENKLDVKSAMVTSRTPNQSVRKLHKLITVSDRLDDLEKRVDLVEQRQDTSEYLLKAVVEMSCREAMKSKAIELIQHSDLTRKQISDITGLSIRTLANYAKEISEE